MGKDANPSGAAPATGATTPPATGTEPTPAAATAATPPATGTPPAAPAAPADALPSAEEVAGMRDSIDRMEKALKAANKEAETRRREANEAERAKMTAEEAAAAELNDLKAQAEAWKVEKAEYHIEREVTRLAPTLGLVDPEAVAKLLDWDAIEFDTEGKPLNVKAQVEELVKSKPYLAGKPQVQPPSKPGTNAGDGTSGDGPKPDLTAAELAQAEKAGLTPVRFAQLRDLQKGSTGVNLEQWQKTRAASGAGGTN